MTLALRIRDDFAGVWSRMPSVRLGAVVRPEVAFAAPVLLSALAWSVPGSSLPLRGFADRTQPTAGGLAVLAAWYGLCVIVVIAGVRIGSRFAPRGVDSGLGPAAAIGYRILTALAIVGVGTAVVLAASHGAIAAAFEHTTGNSLNQAVGGHAGLATLRYTPAISAPFGVWLAIRRRATWLEAALNVLMLCTTALFSSRLSVVLAVVVFIVLAARSWPRARVNLAVLLGGGGLAFVALAALNYLRNAHYYEQWGVTDPLAMNWYQVLSYLAAPFQVSLAWANAIADGSFVSKENVGQAVRVVIPTFIGGKQVPDLNGPAVPVSVAHNLTTNSVFADVLRHYGMLGLAFALVGLLALAVLFGLTRRSMSATGLIAGLVLYVDAEVWRIYLAQQGIFVYLAAAAAVAGLAAAVLSTLAPRISRWLGAARRGRGHFALGSGEPRAD